MSATLRQFLLIRSDPPCRKCRKTEALLRELEAERADVHVRVIARTDPEAKAFGPLVTPMLLLDSKLVCAGVAPLRRGLEKLLGTER